MSPAVRCSEPAPLCRVLDLSDKLLESRLSVAHTTIRLEPHALVAVRATENRYHRAILKPIECNRW
jgi:hypothetical protein